MKIPGRHAVSLIALAIGLLLLGAAVWQMDFTAVREHASELALALPLVLVFSGLWHVARTIAWSACFSAPSQVPFWRLARIRLAAEAFSYLTISGLAGEPLKVVMLDREIELREAAAAVALERLTFVIFTLMLVGGASVAAIAVLPLSSAWLHVFRAFAIVAAVILVLAGAVLAGRGTYLGRVLRSRAERGGTVARAVRFVIDVEGQLLEFVRTRPARLAVIFTTTLACYAAMAAEAWIILRAAGAEVTFMTAATVETFTRVASFASAVVPANLGVLEASSVAATASVGVVSAGAALAIGRRVRGLFWAAVGLAIYPRRSDGRDRRAAGDTLIYAAPPDTPDDLLFRRVAGLPIAERVFRAAVRAGYDRVCIWAPAHDDRLSAIARRVRLEPVRHPSPARAFTAIGPGTIVAPDVLRRAARLDPLRLPLDVPAGPAHPTSGVIRVSAGTLEDPDALARLIAARRLSSARQPTPDDVVSGAASLAIRMASPFDVRDADRAMRASVFKPTDRDLARFNRRMSLPISIALLRTPVTANAFSIGLLFLGLYAGWLFAQGGYAYGVAAAALSLAASILDGCDGEIARLKYQESAFGCWLETIADYTYYLAIFLGMTVGVARSSGWSGYYWIGAASFAGLGMTFAMLIFLRHRMTRDRPERLSSTLKHQFKEGGARWTRFLARLSKAATRAQMPYGILALALVNALPVVLVLCVIGSNLYWMALAIRMRALFGVRPRAGLPSRAAS